VLGVRWQSLSASPTPAPFLRKYLQVIKLWSRLSGHPGDVTRGRALVVSRQEGLCILCHSGPFPEERFQGNLAPDLAASSARLSAAQLRARIVDASRFNPDTIMPSYFRTDGLTRVAPQFAGKTILTAQEIEDVVAFLVSLKP
jgi:sulfur-oxidizing protein SoxX